MVFIRSYYSPLAVPGIPLSLNLGLANNTRLAGASSLSLRIYTVLLSLSVYIDCSRPITVEINDEVFLRNIIVELVYQYDHSN